MNKWLRAAILSVLFTFAAILAISFVTVFIEKPDPSPVRPILTYDRFIQKIDRGEIEGLTLIVNSTVLAQAKDGTKSTVDLLPYDKRLDSILSKNTKVNIYLLPQENNDLALWPRAIVSLLTPIILITALVLLIRFTLKAKSR